MRILAIASGGGHWQQLMRLRPAFAGHDVVYATTLRGLPEQSGAAPAHIVPEANRDTPLRSLGAALRIGWLLLRLRPHWVISTGALPGVIALALGRLIGARTIWVDSVANAEELSMSGRLARRFASALYRQWPDVAETAGARYAGRVI